MSEIFFLKKIPSPQKGKSNMSIKYVSTCIILYHAIEN